MAAESKGRGWLLKGLGCMGLLAAICCCGGFVGLAYFPEMMLAYVLADAPLAGPTTEAKPVLGALERTAACLALATTGEATLSPDAVARLMVGEGSARVPVLRLAAAGDEATLELSVATEDAPPRYFNLQVKAAFELNQGWFTDLRASRLVVRDHDWSTYLSGDQLSAQANQSLANQRAKDEDLVELLDGIQTLRVQDGQFVVRLQPESVAMRRLCSPR